MNDSDALMFIGLMGTIEALWCSQVDAPVYGIVAALLGLGCVLYSLYLREIGR